MQNKTIKYEKQSFSVFFNPDVEIDLCFFSNLTKHSFDTRIIIGKKNVLSK